MVSYEVIYDRAELKAWEGCPRFNKRAKHLFANIVAFSNKIRFTYWYEKRHDVKVVLE